MGLDSPSHHCSTHLFTLYSRFACSKLVISTSPPLLRSYSHFVRERLPWQIIYGKCLTYNIACPHILDMSHNTLSCYFQRCWPVFTQNLTLCLSVSSYIFVRLIMGIFYVAEAAPQPLSLAQSNRHRTQLLFPTYNIWGYYAYWGVTTQHAWDDHYPGCWPIISNCPNLLSIVRGIGHHFF